MDLTSGIDAKNRLAEAMAKAQSDGAEMLSVAFPSLSADAFEILTQACPSGLLFSFENTRKGIAEAAFDFGVPIFFSGEITFKNLETAFPKKRAEISLEENTTQVPAPKIFATGIFENDTLSSAILPLWQITRRDGATRVSAHVFLSGENVPNAASLFNDYAHLKSLGEKNSTPFPPIPKILTETEPGNSEYLPKARKAITAISSGNFEKIVLARARDFTFPSEKNIPEGSIFAALRKRFLAGECTLFFARTNPNILSEKIIGATPEMLALRNGKNLQTEALAGTVANKPGETECRAQSLLRDAKEQKEHRLVVDFVAEKLRHCGLTPKFPETPSALVLPNVIHLHTPIEAEVHADCVSLGKIVSELHPTPAMCGIPADSAKKFIIENEAFPRENFSAPVGFTDANGNGFFAVAIRCAKISGNKVRLYAGSGLVKGSVPEKEFSEIDAKISALASLFQP